MYVPFPTGSNPGGLMYVPFPLSAEVWIDTPVLSHRCEEIYLHFLNPRYWDLRSFLQDP